MYLECMKEATYRLRNYAVGNHCGDENILIRRY
jgi:hypothetical protein